MDEQLLQTAVTEAAERLAVPGVTVGVFHDGAEHYAVHGVTSVERPIPRADAGAAGAAAGRRTGEFVSRDGTTVPW